MFRVFVSLLLSLFLAFPAVAAEQSLTLGGVTITLMDSKCEKQEILSLLKPEVRDAYQAGMAQFPKGTVEKEVYNLCWRVSPNGKTIWAVDEEGETLPEIPLQMFAPKGFI